MASLRHPAICNFLGICFDPPCLVSSAAGLPGGTGGLPASTGARPLGASPACAAACDATACQPARRAAKLPGICLYCRCRSFARRAACPACWPGLGRTQHCWQC